MGVRTPSTATSQLRHLALVIGPWFDNCTRKAGSEIRAMAQGALGLQTDWEDFTAQKSG